MKRPDAKSWVETPEVTRIAKLVELMLTQVPAVVDKRTKTEIRERKGYIQVQIVCTFRIPK